MKLTVQAWAGAKIEILGYELAEWHTTFDIVGPWTLLKFPSDGTEHKSPAKKQEEFLLDTYEKMFNEINEKYDTTFLNRFENVLLMRAERNKWTREQTYLQLYECFDRTLDPKKYNPHSSKNYTKYPADANNAESRTKVLDLLAELEKAEERNYNNYIIQQNQLEIINFIVANEELNKIKNRNGFDPIYRSHATSAIRNFKSKFNREPKQNAEDLKWILEETIRLTKEHVAKY